MLWLQPERGQQTNEHRNVIIPPLLCFLRWGLSHMEKYDLKREPEMAFLSSSAQARHHVIRRQQRQ
jgi:hypothetical protein